MATQARYLPLPQPDEGKQLASVDRAVLCLDFVADPEDEEAPRPEALAAARELLGKVSFWAGSVPEPVAIFALDGGVQVAWKGDDQHLRLFCAPVAADSYIYTSRTVNGKTSESQLTRHLDVFTLADGLRWLQAQ